MKFFGCFDNILDKEKISEDLLHGYQKTWYPSDFSYENLQITFATITNERVFVSDNVIIFFDGTFYNFDESKREFTDCENIFHSYKKDGFKSIPEKINGDYSLVLYDTKSKDLWLSRDRLGIKPLFYHVSKNGIAFASRIRPLLRLPTVTGNFNRGFVARYAASHYRYFDNILNESPYEEIRQLPAASWLNWKNGKFSIGSYWSLKEEDEFTDSKTILLERYRELFLDAVRIRLSKSKKPAFTLSGGMDSSSVLGSAVKLTENKQHAFSSVYKDKTFDESSDIKSMLKDNVIKWHKVKIDKPNFFTLISEMIDVHDEPVATGTWLSHWLLCKDVFKSGFDGLFGGLGGDELNAGEYEYFFYHFADLRMEGKEKKLSEEINMWIKYHNHPIYQKSASLVDDYFSKCIDFKSPGVCLPEQSRLSKYFKALNSEFFDIRSFKPRMDHPFNSYLNNRTYQDLTRETIPCCLRAEDRQISAIGLNNFLPFLDYRLVEFMFKVPNYFKMNNGVTKILLREAMRGILPEDTRNRIKKTGWNAPAHIWFSGEEKNNLLNIVNSNSFKKLGIYNVDKVNEIINEHHEITKNKLDKDNHMMFIWQLINIYIWMKDK